MKGNIKMTKQLTDNEIKELVLAQIEYKKAKDKFDALKAQLTDDLDDGTYVCKYGKVMKNHYIKSITDWKRLVRENPDIDVADYEKQQEVSSVLIQNYNTTTSIFG